MSSDNFNRANENPIASPWAAWGTMSPCRIVSNAVQNSTGTDTDSGLRYTTSTVGSSQWKIVTVGGADGGASIHISGDTGYLTTTSGGQGFMYRLDGPGNFNQLGSPISLTYATNDVIRLRRVGNDVIWSVNGVDVMTRTDTTYTGGNPGALMFSGTLVLDDWTDGVATIVDGGATIRFQGPGVSPDKMNQFRAIVGATDSIAPISITFSADAYGNASSVASMDRGADMGAAITRPGPGISPDYTQLFRRRQFGGANTPAISVTFAADAYGNGSSTGALQTAAQLLADARALASDTAALRTAVQLSGDARALASDSGALQTAIALLADARALASDTGALQTAVQLSAAAGSVASSTAAMGVRVTFVADAFGESCATALLQSGSGFTVDARATAGAAGALQTAVQFAAAGSGAATVTALLTSAGALNADARALASATAALQTRVQFAAAAGSVASVTAALSCGVTLVGSGSSIASASVALLTGVQLFASPAGLASVTALLTIQNGMRADAGGKSSSTAALQTAVRLTAAARALAHASGWLNAAGAFVALSGAIASVTAELTQAAEVLPFAIGGPYLEDGDFGYANPFVNVPTGMTSLQARGPDGQPIGRFGWVDLRAGNIGYRRTGTATLPAFVGRVFEMQRWLYSARGLLWVRQGYPVTAYMQGDFVTRFPFGAVAGQQVFVSVLDGSPVSGYAQDALPTQWRVMNNAAPWQPALISSWELLRV